MNLTEQQLAALAPLMERRDSAAISQLIGGWIRDAQATAWEQGWRASANAMLNGLSLVNPFRPQP